MSRNLVPHPNAEIKYEDEPALEDDPEERAMAALVKGAIEAAHRGTLVVPEQPIPLLQGVTVADPNRWFRLAVLCEAHCERILTKGVPNVGRQQPIGPQVYRAEADLAEIRLKMRILAVRCKELHEQRKRNKEQVDGNDSPEPVGRNEDG